MLNKYNVTVMYTDKNGEIQEETSIVEATDIDRACDMAERSVGDKGTFFFSDVIIAAR